MTVNITYEQALENFRNEVNTKFSPDMGETSRTQRSIKKTSKNIIEEATMEKLVEVDL